MTYTVAPSSSSSDSTVPSFSKADFSSLLPPSSFLSFLPPFSPVGGSEGERKEEGRGAGDKKIGPGPEPTLGGGEEMEGKAWKSSGLLPPSPIPFLLP